MIITVCWGFFCIYITLRARVHITQNVFGSENWVSGPSDPKWSWFLEAYGGRNRGFWPGKWPFSTLPRFVRLFAIVSPLVRFWGSKMGVLGGKRAILDPCPVGALFYAFLRFCTLLYAFFRFFPLFSAFLRFFPLFYAFLRFFRPTINQGHNTLQFDRIEKNRSVMWNSDP